jgi:hypothetical protein
MGHATSGKDPAADNIGRASPAEPQAGPGVSRVFVSPGLASFSEFCRSFGAEWRFVVGFDLGLAMAGAGAASAVWVR